MDHKLGIGWNHKRHFVVSMMFFIGLLLAASVFGNEYSTEPTEPATPDSAVRASRPSHSVPTKTPPRAKRSAVTYSTEDIAEIPSGTDPTTTGARDYAVYRTKMVPDRPHKPEAPNMPETPKGDGYYSGGDPIVGGTMRIRPGPYLAGRHCGRRAFWSGLWDTDISYSWFGNSGGGELTYWPYGYRYLWGDNPAQSDASDWDQAWPVMESDPNTIHDHDSICSPEDIQASDCSPGQPGRNTNESPSDASARPESEKYKNK